MRQLLIKTEAVLVVIVLFFSLVLFIATAIFPAFGINFNVSSSGHSMDPTILDGALFVWADRVPFSGLEVGDIIIYRNWAIMTQNRWAKASATTKLNKEPDTTEEKQTYRDEGIEYAPDKYTLHRIVEIRQDEEYLDRALLTKGDNNRNVDPYPTFESGYVGVVTWHMNYLGWPFRIMYTHYGLLWLMGISAALGVFLLIKRPAEIGS